MNLNHLRDRAYKIVCDHGFHDKELSNEHFLCLVISELMEAVEADRKGKRVNRRNFDFAIEDIGDSFKSAFEIQIKDTVEDELADACIRLLDLAGLRNIDIEDFSDDSLYESSESCYGETFPESIYAISTIPARFHYESFDALLNNMLIAIFGLARHLGIDLMWHIEHKMTYNELRENMHGKKY